MACYARFQDHIADGIYDTLVDPDKYRLKVFRLFIAQKQEVCIKRIQFCDNLQEPMGIFKDAQSCKTVIDKLLEKANVTKQFKLKLIQKQINQRSWVPPEVWAAKSREEKEIIIRNKDLKLKEIDLLSKDPNLELKTVAHVERVINAPNFTTLPTLMINPDSVAAENSWILNQSYLPNNGISSTVYSPAEQNGISVLLPIYNMNKKLKIIKKAKKRQTIKLNYY